MSVSAAAAPGRSRIVVAGLLFLLAGCSGSKPVTSADDRDLEYYIEHIDQYEDFDEVPYIDPPPLATDEIEHDVPEMLMSGSAAENSRVLQTIQGFRIQIHSSLDKEGAVSAEERAKAWWDALPPEERPGSMSEDRLPIYLKYVQPYYRVRVGDFATREEAEIALELISSRFPRAFIAIDTVTVWR